MKYVSFVHRTLTLCTLMFSLCTFAQTTITGRVMDGASNESAIGATVMVVGTTVGTVSDFDGNFTLEVPDGKFILQVSMVGFKTQVINIRGKNHIEVTLQEDTQEMDEVVVVGYGTMKNETSPVPLVRLSPKICLPEEAPMSPSA